MNLEDYKARNGLSTNDVVSIVQQEFPKFSKHQFSMVKRGIYGVVLAPRAVKVLNAAHPPKKENRVRGNSMTIRLNDYLFGLLLTYCEETGRTRQDAVEAAIYTMLTPEARRSEPDELNSKLRRNLKDCRNELCLRCGEYRTAHLGSCDGCRWKDMGEST